MPSTPSATGGQSVETRTSTVQTQLMLHYETIAYALVVTAYVFSFGEYLFFRLTYLFNPEKVIYHAACQKHSSTIIGKGALNYVAVMLAFIFVALFQIICFFGLTISEKWVKFRVGNRTDPATKLRKLLSQRIRGIMESTVYPTFICYGLASVSVWLIIFYMVGVRDSIDQLASTISLYIFDAIIILYFFAFPIITYVYHPYLRKSAALAMMYATGVRNLRPLNQFGRQILPSASFDSQASSPETRQQPVANPPWFRPPRPARTHFIRRGPSGRVIASSYDNPRFHSPAENEQPGTFHRNARFTSTV